MSAVTWSPFTTLAPVEKAAEPAKVEAEGTKAETKLPVTYQKVSYDVHIGDAVKFNADNKDSEKPMKVTIEVTYPKASKKKPGEFPQKVTIAETVPAGEEKPIIAVEKVQKELKNRGIRGKVQAHVKVTVEREGEAPQTTERDVNLKKRSYPYYRLPEFTMPEYRHGSSLFPPQKSGDEEDSRFRDRYGNLTEAGKRMKALELENKRSTLKWKEAAVGRATKDAQRYGSGKCPAPPKLKALQPMSRNAGCNSARRELDRTIADRNATEAEIRGLESDLGIRQPLPGLE